MGGMGKSRRGKERGGRWRKEQGRDEGRKERGRNRGDIKRRMDGGREGRKERVTEI